MENKEVEKTLKKILGLKRLCKECFSCSDLKLDQVEIVPDRECEKLLKIEEGFKKQNGIS